MKAKSSKHLVYAQTCADVTRESCDLYDDEGVPRVVLSGWPCRGTFIRAFCPRRGEGV